MSTPDPGTSPRETAAKGRLVAALRVLAALSIVVSFASLWLSERTRVLDDLQLASEAAARPGETIALRAFYLRDVDAPRGPELVEAPVTVRLLDARERALDQIALRPARGDTSMEGRLTLPATLRGALTLEARAQLPGRAPTSCRRQIDVRPDAPMLVPRAREAAPLSLRSLGALRPLQSAAIASPPGLRLEPRVVGGACVPEQPCRLLVWMGGRAALRVRHDASLRLASVAPAMETDGFVELTLNVFGPEATLVLEAVVAEQRVAERSLRLPVALGEAQLDAAPALLEAGRAPSLHVALPPGRKQGILDFFARGRWSATRAFVGAATDLALPPAWLVPGLSRVQAHADRFAGEGAGTRLLYVRTPAQTAAQALSQIARVVQAAGFEALPLTAQGTLPAGVDPELSAAFMLAALESQRVPLPRAVSGRPPELRRLARAQTALRFGVGGLLALSALVVFLTLLRRGFSAEREAQAILVEARGSVGDLRLRGGDGVDRAGGSARPEHASRAARPDDPAEEGADEPGPTRNNAPSHGVLVVVGVALSVALAFVLAALLIVAKTLWF